MLYKHYLLIAFTVATRFILCEREEVYEGTDGYGVEELMTSTEEATRNRREELLAQVNFDK